MTLQMHPDKEIHIYFFVWFVFWAFKIFHKEDPWRTSFSIYVMSRITTRLSSKANIFSVSNATCSRSLYIISYINVFVNTVPKD